MAPFFGGGPVFLGDNQEFNRIFLEKVGYPDANRGIGYFLATAKPVGLGLAHFEFFS